MKTTVTVCLCTFKRSSLSATLKSLDQQILPPFISLDIVVVDSDAAGSASPLVQQAQASLSTPIRYFTAVKPGVAEARNLAVRESTGQWLAFIDDDETAASDWLAKLLDCANQYSASVVFGAVRTIYPSGCPEWIESSDLFGKTLPSTGTRVTEGPTCNTLVARSALAGETTIFDVAFGSTGGEDTELFSRLSQKGIPMVSCQEAIVSETVETHRLNRNFLIRKALRVGETYYRIFFSKKTLATRSLLLIKAGAQSLIAAVIALAMLPFGLGKSMRYQIKAAANFGKLRAAAGHAGVELYKG